MRRQSKARGSIFVNNKNNGKNQSVNQSNLNNSLLRITQRKIQDNDKVMNIRQQNQKKVSHIATLRSKPAGPQGRRVPSSIRPKAGTAAQEMKQRLAMLDDDDDEDYDDDNNDTPKIDENVDQAQSISNWIEKKEQVVQRATNTAGPVDRKSRDELFRRSKMGMKWDLNVLQQREVKEQEMKKRLSRSLEKEKQEKERSAQAIRQRLAMLDAELSDDDDDDDDDDDPPPPPLPPRSSQPRHPTQSSHPNQNSPARPPQSFASNPNNNANPNRGNINNNNNRGSPINNRGSINNGGNVIPRAGNQPPSPGNNRGNINNNPNNNPNNNRNTTNNVVKVNVEVGSRVSNVNFHRSNRMTQANMNITNPNSPNTPNNNINNNNININNFNDNPNNTPNGNMNNRGNMNRMTNSPNNMQANVSANNVKNMNSNNGVGANRNTQNQAASAPKKTKDEEEDDDEDDDEYDEEGDENEEGNWRATISPNFNVNFDQIPESRNTKQSYSAAFDDSPISELDELKEIEQSDLFIQNLSEEAVAAILFKDNSRLVDLISNEYSDLNLDDVELEEEEMVSYNFEEKMGSRLEGFLLKQNSKKGKNSFTRWQKRWFSLQHANLVYYRGYYLATLFNMQLLFSINFF